MVHKIDERLLKKLIAIPSPYPDEERLGSFIAGMFLKKGYEVYVQKVTGERSNIIVEKGTGKNTIVLYSHIDTVAPVVGWSGNPFTPRQEGDRLYGLGSYDMKGGMAVNIETFLQFEPKNIKLRILFCVDEENISSGGFRYASSSFMKDTDCVLSPEPAFDYGLQGIVTGRIGRAVIEISLRKKPVHFFYYAPHEDIHIFASSIISSLKKLYRQKGDRKEFVYVRNFSSKTTGMSTPEQVTIELDSSVLPPHTNDDILRAVKSVVQREVSGNDISVTVAFKNRSTPFLSGYELSKSDSYLQVMKKTVEAETGKKAYPYFRSSVADENIFGSYGKTVLGVGPVGGNAHSANEYVSLSSMQSLHGIYMDFLRVCDGQAG